MIVPPFTSLPKFDFPLHRFNRTFGKPQSLCYPLIPVEAIPSTYGSDVTDDDAQEAYELLKSKLDNDLEIVLVNGGQPIYYYIVSVE